MSEPQRKRARLSGPGDDGALAAQHEGPGGEGARAAREEEGRRGQREGLGAEFAVVTGADEAVAQCYLADNDWLLERALNSYFETPAQPPSLVMESTSQLAERADFQGCIDLTDTDSVQTSKGDGAQPQVDESHISLLTWNVDGLDLANLQERARGVCSCLALYNPDIVFLQEVIEPYYLYLKKRAVSYTIIPGDEDDYYTAIMLKKSRVKLLKQEITPYPTSSMKRNLLTVQVNIAGNELCLMTSHLESTKAHSQERMKQLEIVLKKIKEAPESATVIFGGDTNLRDQELAGDCLEKSRISAPNDNIEFFTRQPGLNKTRDGFVEWTRVTCPVLHHNMLKSFHPVSVQGVELDEGRYRGCKSWRFASWCLGRLGILKQT
ncbi:tyrosyl-DNA phosphodiesterase 2 isoform X2 [Scyliorhinus torazame]|uniref:tyrosyl-DNA phosphodiesterase 2 isoform X2 n=1 Tax=Scyliorhinus torazame TaxID=75743 RepID=UPI003B5B9A3B